MALKPDQHSHDAFPLFDNPQVPASTIVEFIASRSDNTSEVYVYDDVVETTGFGSQTLTWSSSNLDGTAPTIYLQARSGAGLSLVGRLSSKIAPNIGKITVVTAFSSLSSLTMMAPALSHMPGATFSNRLVVHIPTLTLLKGQSRLTPSLSSLSSVMSILPQDLVIIASASPQEIVAFTELAYKLSSHVLHFFDAYIYSRETGHRLKPRVQERIRKGKSQDCLTVFREAGFQPFRYEGNLDVASAIILVNGALALSIAAVARHSNFGVVIVSVLRPWSDSALCSIIPPSIQTLHVINEVHNSSGQGFLFHDVLTAVHTHLPAISVRCHAVTPEQTAAMLPKSNNMVRFLSGIVSATLKTPKTPCNVRNVLFLASAHSPRRQVAQMVQRTFLSRSGISTHQYTNYDLASKAGGIAASHIILSPEAPNTDSDTLPLWKPSYCEEPGSLDFLAILDHNLLKTHDVLIYCKPGSSVFIDTTWSPQELILNIPSSVIETIRLRNIRVFLMNTFETTSDFVNPDIVKDKDEVQNYIIQLIFVRLYLGDVANETLVLRLCPAPMMSLKHIELLKLNARTWSTLQEVDVTAARIEIAQEIRLKQFAFNSVAPLDGPMNNTATRLTSWHDAARHIMFPEVYSPPAAPTDSEDFGQNLSLRPDAPEHTYLITCTVNRRLTPMDYDRNVFHVEFDTSGTGLKYAIGEALGIHGWNDEQEVLDFCAWYGVNPNHLVSIPITAGNDREHTRTVFQALQQQIDIFGRPPKSFYTDLAQYATNSVDKHALLFIGSAEGSATFKVMAERDTVTFADVLGMYPSARPGIEVLCQLVGDIKPRHYSIASAQDVVGDRVDLLVVTVEWVIPGGPTRYGQCTRYLNDLKVGQKVTVSIKPSVMKLPPENKQPLIMAGLGTGAAPFRAFLQQRAWQAQNGIEVGPIYYYFGSRHRSQEYLYGEEIQAFIEDGVITKAGLAFSRDGPKKVYIQHKMLEDAETLVGMLKDQKGVFYLCAPTWPVPDVYEALVNALVSYRRHDPEEAAAYLEGLKEEERYILEVY